MRITESRMIDLAGEAVNQGRARVARTGEQLSSGERVSRPSQDPAAWAQARRAEAARTIGAGRSEAIARAQEGLALADDALASITESLSRARELATTAATESTTPDALQAILIEVRGLRGSALAAANTRSVDGEYIFSGSLTSTPAFAADGTFQGDATTRSVEAQAGLSQTVTISGASLTASAGPGAVDVFGQLGALEAALVAGDRDAIAATLDGLRAAGQQVSAARAQGGAHSAELTVAEDAQRTLDESLVALESRLVGTDPIAAATELAQHSTALSAAQTVAQRIIELTRP